MHKRWSIAKLEKTAQKNTALRQVKPFEQVKKIGVLFDCTREEETKAVMGYVEKLRAAGKLVIPMAFYNKKKLPVGFDTWHAFRAFSRHELNWMGLPKGQISPEFYDNSLDLLLNFFNNTHIPLLAINAGSAAKLRVGPYGTKHTAFLDLMIEYPEGQLSKLIELTDFYLRKLKP